MKAIDNGGANAIKGFNYQKSVVMLIAVLHFLDSEDFELFVETKDDIVFSSTSGTIYLQAKSGEMNVTGVTTKRKGAPSVLEKNISGGTDDSDIFKIVTPSFKDSGGDLYEVDAALITKGAKVFKYSEDALEKIKKRLPGISQEKLKRARVALTAFDEDQTEALYHIQGIMASMGIPVDNNHGLRSLEELIKEIDQRSAIIVKGEDDYKKKRFTPKDLSSIFSHSHKLKLFNDTVDKLGYSIAKQHALKDRRVSVAAIHSVSYSDAVEVIGELDIMELSEAEVISRTLNEVDFVGVEDHLMKEAIVIDAYSQAIYEKVYL